MKKIFLLIIVIVNIKSTFAQGTTQEEYNYMTVGYAQQLAGGLDMKKGYEFKDLGTWFVSFGNLKRQCTFKTLIRTETKKSCGILMIYNRVDNGYTAYACIPTPDAPDELWNKTFNFLESNSTQTAMMESVVWSLMKLSSQYNSRP